MPQEYKNGLFRCSAKFTPWGLRLISNNSLCSHVKDASIAVWDSSDYLLGHTFCSFCPEPSRKSTCGRPAWTAATSWIEVEHGAGFKPRRQCETVPCSIVERFL